MGNKSRVNGRARRAQDGEEEAISLVDRLLCAVFGPVFVNVGIVLLLGLFKQKYFDGNWFGNGLSITAWSQLPTHSAPLVLTVLVPAVCGFVLGSARFATLMGHMFYTNHANVRSPWITGAIWLLFAGYAWFLQDALLARG